MLVEGGSWNTMLPCEGFVVRLSVVGSRDDDDLTLGVEPTADVWMAEDEPDMVRAGTSTARGVWEGSFGSVRGELSDLIRCS